MYFNALGVRVVAKDGNSVFEGSTVEEWVARVPAEMFDLPGGDAFMSDLQRFVFAEAGEPGAYSVTLSVRRVGEGAA